MNMINITLKDGSLRQIPADSTGYELAESISRRLAKEAVAARIDGEVKDLRTRLQEGNKVELITSSDPEALEVLRHSAAHLMAHAVIRLFPGTKLGIGPSIKEGFYYDFAVAQPFKPEDLPRIEAEMKRLAEIGRAHV